MSHRNAPLTPQGRLLLCRRIEAGSPIAHVAATIGISRRCASKWWHRYLGLGTYGLCDRSSRPRRSPRRVTERVEAKICIGYANLHNAIDDYSRVAYTEVLADDEAGRTCAGFWRRAEAWFRARGVIVERVIHT